MNNKRAFISFCAVVLICLMTANVYGASIAYLPDVTSEMSDYSYWTTDDSLLMTYEEITQRNAQTVATSGTCMYNLKNQAQTVDGEALNEAVLNSSRSDASYYTGWTYIESDVLATSEDYEKIVANTQNPNPSKVQNVLYGIAVKRTALRTFPSLKAIWDDPADCDLDYQYLAAVRVNEPVVITSVSADGKYYLAKSICCSGWIPSEDVAICSDKTQWLSAWDVAYENALIVYGDKVFTETSVTGANTSDLMLTMGTVLKKADIEDPNDLVDNRSVYQNYAVWIPVRNPDGSYGEKLTLISEHEKVSDGYLPMTKENISKVAFCALGNTYGWGGSLSSDDCSGYIRNVYKCFGLELARNTTWQSLMPMAKVDMQNMCKEERMKFLDSLPFGTVLYFNGHEMLYLGKENGRYYVISAVGSIMQPLNPSVRQRIRSTVVNTLDVKRANGNTWLEDLTVALVPYFSAESNVLPQYEWYHDGVSFCIKNEIMNGDENKYFHPLRSISWAEFLQILWNIDGKKVSEEEAASSVENSQWYTYALSWARRNNLVYKEDHEFLPQSEMTREEIASVLYLYAKHKGVDVSIAETTSLSSYEDRNHVSKYAVSAVKFVVAKGIMQGKTETTINPEDTLTRGELAVIIKNFSDIIE